MRVETWQAPPGDRIPNNPRFPVLIYHDVDAAAAGPESARQLFAQHGWGGSWVDGVFGFHHFHSTSHEALAVVAGRATLELGGPQGTRFDVSAGDVLVLPAGTGHRRASSDAGFTVVGAYPAGQEDYDVLRGDDPDEARGRSSTTLGLRPTRQPAPSDRAAAVRTIQERRCASGKCTWHRGVPSDSARRQMVQGRVVPRLGSCRIDADR